MSKLTPEQLERYKRHLFLEEIGPIGQRKLLDARVLLIGVGGLGSPASLYLAATGVGTLGLVDFDAVDASNLQRQILYTTADVGRPKVEAAAERLRALNPDVTVEFHSTKLDASNAMEWVGGYDIVLDGTDTFPSRYLTNDVCVWQKVPLVYGSVMRFEGQVSVFDARIGPCYRCLFPEPPPPELAPNCAEAGVLGVLPGVIGLMQATEVIKLIVGQGEPLVGRLLTYDALSMETRTFKLGRDPDCAVCGDGPSITEPIDYEAFCSASGASGPSEISEIDPHNLQQRLAADEPPLLIDVREPFEAELAKIAGARLIPLGTLESALADLAAWKNRPVIVHCQTGGRSRKACEILVAHGFNAVVNLRGGIEAWQAEVDSGIPKK